jgi:hypothetical protein
MDFLWTIHPRLALTYCGGWRPWPNAHAAHQSSHSHPPPPPTACGVAPYAAPASVADVAAGFAQTNLPVPWLGRKWLQLIIG